MTLEPHHPSQLTHLILITSFISSSTAHVFIHHPSTVMFSCRPSYNVLKCVINISHKVSFVCLHQLSCHSCHSPCSFLNCLSSMCVPFFHLVQFFIPSSNVSLIFILFIIICMMSIQCSRDVIDLACLLLALLRSFSWFCLNIKLNWKNT